MMRRQPLRTVMLAGTLFAAGGPLLHQLPLVSSPEMTRSASAMDAMLASIRQRIQMVLAHVLPAQLVEGIGLVWFIFILALLLFSRPRRDHRPDPEEQLARVWPSEEYISTPLGQDNGHLLALIGIVATERRRMPYRLFLVAECRGVPSDQDEARWRALEVVASQVVPLLADDKAVAREHFSALCEIAVLRATHVLEYNGAHTSDDLRTLAAGILVIGNDVYVVNVGHFRAYLFRPSTGLLQITMDFLAYECRRL